MPDDLDVLPGGVKDLDHVVVGHQLEKGREIEIFGERVDGDGVIVAGELDHADLGPERGLAQKFGIDRHVGVFRESLTIGGQFGGICDEAHEGFIIQGSGRG